MQIRIEGTDLPGTGSGAADVEVGIQRRNRPSDVLDRYAADSPDAVWTFDATVAAGPNGLDVRGPFIQGGPAQRFIYLSWGTVDSGGTFTMFRRAKLMLDDVPADVIAAAERSGRLTARLGLTDQKGGPVCARVRPPAIQWTAE